MIDARRWTATERAIVRDALEREREALIVQHRRTRSRATRDDVAWRRFEVVRILDAIGPE